VWLAAAAKNNIPEKLGLVYGGVCFRTQQQTQHTKHKTPKNFHITKTIPNRKTKTQMTTQTRKHKNKNTPYQHRTNIVPTSYQHRTNIWNVGTVMK
jgi:hypothetical protein